MKKKDKLEFFLQNKLSLRGKLLVISLLLILWLKVSSNLYFMILFFGASLILSVVVMLYELIFYKNIYKK